jgi:hypothetical protein
MLVFSSIECELLLDWQLDDNQVNVTKTEPIDVPSLRPFLPTAILHWVLLALIYMFDVLQNIL